MDPSESVGVNRLESVGGVWAGIAKRNNKRLVASDVPRSFSRFLKGQRTLHINRIKLWNFRWNLRWTKQEAIYIASDVTRFFGVYTGLESQNEARSDKSLAMFLAHVIVFFPISC